MSAAKKAKITTVFPDKIDGVDKPLLQTLATVCQKLYDEELYTSFKPKDGGESNEKLDQPYELIKKGGEYTDDAGEVISGVSIFNKDTKTTASIAEYGKVIDGITDFHGEFQAAFPPFAALIVQPKDETAVRSPTRGHPPCLVVERMLLPPPFLVSQLPPLWQAPILILAWRGSVTVFDWINDAAGSPTLCRPPPRGMCPQIEHSPATGPRRVIPNYQSLSVSSA